MKSFLSYLRRFDRFSSDRIDQAPNYLNTGAAADLRSKNRQEDRPNTARRKWSQQLGLLLLCSSGLLLFPFSIQNAQAEGTKEMTADPTGYRPWFNSPTGGYTYLGINQKLVVNVYANPGEIINVGSSGVGLCSGLFCSGATIVLKSPSGTTYTANGAGGVGVINNRSEELAGPTPNAGGYIPFTRTVAANEGGVWQITYVSPGDGSNGTLVNTTNWTRSANQGTSSSTSGLLGIGGTSGNGGLLAWDATVRSTSGSTIGGRAYITNMGVSMGSFYPSTLKSLLYVLTKEGYIYQLNTNTLAPLVFNLFSNNKGFTSGGNPTYLSLNSDPTVGTNVQDPYAADSGTNVTNKMFLNPPAGDLPFTATVAGGGSTWLNNIPVDPIVSNFTFTPNGGSGGTFTFNSNVAGSYGIELDVNNNGAYTDSVDRVIQGASSTGANSVVWDGRDGAGTVVSNPVNFQVRISTRSGEVHFPLADAESNPGGFIINRLNGAGAGDSTIYWNDSNITVSSGKTASNPIKSLTGTASSPLGAHNWGSTSSAQAGEFGDAVGLDTWTFMRSNFIYLFASVSGKVWDDADGSANNTFTNINNGAEIGANVSPLYALLLNSSNQVIARTTVNSDGTYTFGGVAKNTNNLSVILSTTPGTIGAVATPSLPAGWVSTSPLTISGINVGTTDVTGKDFGIERTPTTNDISADIQTNPIGNGTVQVPDLNATDPEDGSIGTGGSFKITTLATNGTLYYNGVAVTLNQVITNYNPALLTVDPIDGYVTVTFYYAAIDKAGKEDPSPAKVDLPFRAPISTAVYCSKMYGVSTDNTNTTSQELGAPIYEVSTSGGYTKIGTAAIRTAAMAVQPSTGKIFYVSRSTTANQQVYYWDPTDNKNYKLPSLTTIPSTVTPVRAAFSVDDQLWVGTGDSKLYQISTTTGSTIGTPSTVVSTDTTHPIGTTGANNGDMAFDGNNVLFFFNNNDLYAVDTKTNNAYYITSAPSGATFNSLAFANSNSSELYAYNSTTSGSFLQGFYAINTNTGVPTFVANPTFPNTSTVGTDLGSCAAPLPVIRPTKTVAKVGGSTGAQIHPGDTLEYTITVPNTGNVVTSQTTFKDPLPAGTTYVPNSTKLNGTAVTDGPGNTFPYDTTTGKPISSNSLSAGTIGWGNQYAVSVVFRVRVNNSNFPPGGIIKNQAKVNFFGSPTNGIPTDDPNTTKAGDATEIGITPAKVMMVKRITRINGLTTNPNDSTKNLTQVVANPADPNDQNPNWPSGYLKGGYNLATAGLVKPGDEIEYTIYFLNAQGTDASGVKTCDRINGAQTYVPNSMTVQMNGATTPTVLTDANDDTAATGNLDRGQFYPTGATIPNSCNLSGSTVSGTDNGTVELNITGAATANQTAMPVLPGATGTGAPTTSYGFFRFKAKVK